MPHWKTKRTQLSQTEDLSESGTSVGKSSSVAAAIRQTGSGGGGGGGCHATLQHKHHHVTNVTDIRGSFGEYTHGEYTQAAAAAGRSHSYALPPAEQPDRVARPCQPAHQLIPLPLHLLTAVQVSGAPLPPDRLMHTK